MNNKEIQEQRIRGYFVDATKNILKSEGLKGISVRNISKEAGYSYATLYNYFKDVRFLVFECVKDFLNECNEFINERIKDKSPGIERLRAISKSYIDYFLEYPGIFELFFIEKLSAYGNSNETVELIYKHLDLLCEADWKAYSSKFNLSDEFIEKLKGQLQNMLIGSLLFYINRNYPASYEEFISRTEKQMDYIWG